MPAKVEMQFYSKGRSVTSLKEMSKVIRSLDSRESAQDPRDILRNWDIESMEINPLLEPQILGRVEVSGDLINYDEEAFRVPDVILMPEEKSPRVKVLTDRESNENKASNFFEGKGNLMLYELKHGDENLLVGLFPWVSDDYSIGKNKAKIGALRKSVVELEEKWPDDEHPFIEDLNNKIRDRLYSNISYIRHCVEQLQNKPNSDYI